MHETGQMLTSLLCDPHPLSPLPPGLPAEGADGADIVVVCDPSLDSLLHLHKRKEWAGRRGAQGNPAVGSAGPKRLRDKKAATAPLEIPVPPGTVVKRKGGQVREVARGGVSGAHSAASHDALLENCPFHFSTWS